MNAGDAVLIAGWAAFWIYWFVSAFSMRRGRVPWRHELGIRVIIIAGVAVLARAGVFRHSGTHHEVWADAVGLLVWAAGLTFAVWARVNIGRNWGMPMTEHDNAELVTSGPYRLVRHPIYSGILLGILGTAIAINWFWLLAFGYATIYFLYAAILEERYLVGVFPAAYPEYRQHTKRRPA